MATWMFCFDCGRPWISNFPLCLECTAANGFTQEETAVLAGCDQDVITAAVKGRIKARKENTVEKEK